MKIFQKNKKLIYIIIAFIIIALVIILPVYFLVIKKSSSSSSSSSLPSDDSTFNPDTIGVCYIEKKDGVNQPQTFEEIHNFFIKTNIEKTADEGGLIGDRKTYEIQLKWAYDKTNPLYVLRYISNINKTYTDDELTNLGKPISGKSGEYLVNKIITKYDEKNDRFNTGTWWALNPIILKTYSQCM
jgi:hypothetical protein